MVTGAGSMERENCSFVIQIEIPYMDETCDGRPRSLGFLRERNIDGRGLLHMVYESSQKPTLNQSRNIKNTSSTLAEPLRGSSAMSPISTNVITALLRTSTRLNCNLRSSIPISRLPRHCTQRTSPDYWRPPSTLPSRPVDLSAALPSSSPIHRLLTSIVDSKTTGQANSIIGTFQETVCLAGSHE
jgi:hypothetical protein